MSGYSPPEKYLCSPFVSQFWFYIFFFAWNVVFFLSLAHFYVNFLSLYSSEKASDWYEFQDFLL